MLQHVLLTTTIQYHYCDKQLATILNCLDHCESYTFVLEMESSLARALTDSSQHLTPHIVTGEGSLPSHLELDNMNKFTA